MVFSRFSWGLLVALGCAAAGPEDVCLRPGTARGATMGGGACPPGMSRLGLACATNCPAGSRTAGLTCSPLCPAGFTEEEDACRKPAPTSRPSFGWQTGDRPFDFDTGPRARCEARFGPGACARAGHLWVGPCGGGASPLGDLVCASNCPAGTRDEAPFAGSSLPRARSAFRLSAGSVFEDGRCVTPCPSGWTTAAHRCLAPCPAHLPVPCGAWCARDAASCGALPGDPRNASAASALVSLLAAQPLLAEPVRAALRAGLPGVALAASRANPVEPPAAVEVQSRAWRSALPPRDAESLWARALGELAEAKAEGLFDFDVPWSMDRGGVAAALAAADRAALCPAQAVPGPACGPGTVAFAGVCHRVTPGFTLESATAQAPACPAGFRGVADECWPAWNGPSGGAWPYPVLVSDCGVLPANPAARCPANFAPTGACACTAVPTRRPVLPLR